MVEIPPPGTLRAATAVAESAAALAQTRWDDVDGAELLETAYVLARAQALIDAATVGLTGRLETSRAIDQTPWASVKDFLTHLTGGHKGTGGSYVRAAEQLRDLPAVTAALNAGDISLPQARAIAGKATTLPRDHAFRTTVADRMLALVATHGHDASDLQTAFAGIAREVDTEGLLAGDRSKEKEERGAHHARYLGFSEDGLGGVKLRGYCSLEDSERVKTALMSLAAPITTEPGACGGAQLPPGEPMLDDNGHYTAKSCPDPHCGHDGRDPRDHGRRMWDALVELCDRATAAEVLPHDHGTAARIIITIDQDSLRQQLIDAGLAHDGTLGSQQSMSAAAVRRLACDGEIIPAVLGAHGEILDVGRAHRLVTSAIWLALVLRDRHCAFPGCTRPPIACEAHHIIHWADGGTTSLDNLMLLCRRHHTLVHHTPWAVAVDPRTHRPVWTPPPPLDVRSRITFRRGERPPSPQRTRAG